MPTSTPPAITLAQPASTAGIENQSSAFAATAAAISPTRNAARHPASLRPPASSPPTMPLMPAMRPSKNTSSAAAAPINRPPANDRPGVK